MKTAVKLWSLVSLLPLVTQVLWTSRRATYELEMAATVDSSDPPVLLTASEAATAQPPLPPRTMESLTSDVVLFDGELGCTVEEGSELKFLGNGMTGHAFAADLVCPRGKHRVVIKVRTALLTTTNGLYRYASYSQEDVRKYRTLHDRVIGTNATKEESERVKKNLIVPIGTVALRRSLLYDHMNAINEGTMKEFSGRYRGMANATDETEEPLLGTIYPFSSGSSLEENATLWSGLSAEDKRRIVRDLVYQWRYMYERGVVQCELFGNVGHIFYSASEHQTSVIDFQKHRVIPEYWTRERRDEKQRKQLRQLLTMLGNFCTTSPEAVSLSFKKAPFRVQNKICGRHEEGKPVIEIAFLLQVVNATDQWCNFNERLPWNSRTAVNDTAQLYQDLSDWSGLQAKPVVPYN